MHHFEQEVMITRIGQVLLVGKMSNEERAALHFERGVLYDSLGLWGLARYDFTQALALRAKDGFRLQLFRALLTT